MQNESDYNQEIEEKLLILKQKALSFITQQIFFVWGFSLWKITQFFYSKANQGLKLISRSTYFFVLKSSFDMNSLIAKLESVALYS